MNLRRARAALRDFEQAVDPRDGARAILDAHRFSYGALINALDADDKAMASAARGLHQRIHALLVDVLSAD